MTGQNFGKAMISAIMLSFVLAGAAAAGDRNHDRDDRRHHDRHDRNDRHDRHEYKKDRHDHDRRGPHSHRDDRHDRYDRHGRKVVVIDRGARTVIHNYYGGYYRDIRDCPRGFKLKHGVCRPKGWAKQRYVIGQPLPRYVVVQPMPPRLMRDLPPPPYGHVYRYVDGDVLMVAEATHRVVDAVVAVNAAMNALR